MLFSKLSFINDSLYGSESDGSNWVQSGGLYTLIYETLEPGLASEATSFPVVLGRKARQLGKMKTLHRAAQVEITHFCSESSQKLER